MKILKRDGTYERLSFDKILYRIRKLANDKSLGPLKTVDPDIISQKVVNSIYDGISSWELDEEAARISVGMTENREYPKLAARIVVSNLHKSTIECFSEVMEMLYEYTDETTGYNAGIISDEIIQVVRKHKDTLNFCMDFSRDYNFDYFGFKTLEKSYLLKINKRIKLGDSFVNKMIVVERPQHMYLRVALGLFKDDIPNVLKTYDLISRGLFTFASPTLFNAATRMGQLSSCFTGDTIVTTVNRGPIQIKDVKIGDQVITHLGNIKQVVQLHRNHLGSRKLFNLNLFNTVNIKVTDNHPLYVIRPEQTGSKDPFWLPVEDLSLGDYVAIPKHSGGAKDYQITIWNENEIKGVPPSLTIQINSDFAKFLALHYSFVALTNTFFSKNDEYYLFLGRLDCIKRTKKLDSTLINWYITFIKTHFQLDANYDHHVFSMLENLFGNYNQFWQDIWNWHNDLIIKFAETLWTFNLNKYLPANMLNQLYYLLRNKGFPVSSTDPLGSFEAESNMISVNGNTFLKFLDKTEIDDPSLFKPDSIVYTLGIEDDHSYNVGGIIAQNCFLLGTDDSIDGIFKTITDCAKISKVAGGIGVHVSNIRGKGSLIRGTHGTSDGIIPMLKVYNDTSLYINQCLVPETIVYSRRGPLRMDEVELGDALITSDGTFQNVTKIHINEKVNDQLLEIIAGGISLKCTDVHHILVQIDDYPLQFLAASDILYYFNQKKHTLRLYFPQLSYVPEYSEFVLWTAAKKEAYQRFLAVQNGEMEEYPVIEDIRTFDYTGLVYDFTVNWNHNYLTNAGIVHNSGKRKGSFAIYLEPWHSDIFEFLDLKKNQGHDNVRARDLFYAMWIPDLFMKCVEDDTDWYLMCPDECPGLTESHSSTFEELYNKYVSEGRYRKKIKAQELWFKILESQMETGTPYLLYKDAANRKSNQRNYGTIKSSNLCVDKDTLILTKNGYLQIGNLVNRPVTVWNGSEWSNVTVHQTGTNQQLINVTLNDGTELRCTKYHKFYDRNGKEIRAGDLLPGTALMAAKRYPLIDNITSDDTLNTPYLNGLLVANGQTDTTQIKVPINANVMSRVSWLEGFFDGFKMSGHSGLRFTFNSISFVKDLKLFFHTMGINPITSMPFNHVTLDQQLNWDLQLTIRDIQCLKNLGLKSLPTLAAGTYTGDFVLRVASVTPVEGLHDTFCFTEPLRGKGIFNGILTGQCSEIILYSSPDEVAVCFTGDTQILTDTGYKRIDECDNANVLSYFNNDTDLIRDPKFIKAKLINNGVKDVYELKCTGMKPIKVTENHPFVLHLKRNYNTKQNFYTWKSVKEFTKSDRILIPDTEVIPIFDTIISNENLNENYLAMGWLIGDGWQSSGKTGITYGVCFGPNDSYARDTVIKTLHTMAESVPLKKYGTHLTSLNYYTDRNGVFVWSSKKLNFIKHIQDTYGIQPKTAIYKEIPDKIKRAEPIAIASFLSGLFSADGTVYIKNEHGKKTSFYIGLSSSSQQLLYDVQILLRNFGIKSRIVYGSVKSRKNSQGHITIEHIKSILNFQKYINFLLSHEKKIKLDIGIQTIKKREQFNSTCNVQYLKYIGKEVVYDLCVPETHNFVAENFVVHNCNLSSIALPKFVEVNGKKRSFDFQQLKETARFMVHAMNRVIDANYYAIPEAKYANMKHRPLGLGVQGLNDAFVLMRFPFESSDSKELNRRIFEAIYYGSIEGSIDMAEIDGPYETYHESPSAQGLLQFDLWAEEDPGALDFLKDSPWDWAGLKERMKKFGLRNCMLTTCMPTASTAQILGNTECIEPIDSCIFKRRVLSGDFTVINKHLVEDLEKLELWSNEMKERIILANGSVQTIPEIPDDIRALYKTVWEISQKTLIDYSADRGPFIDHSQSLNLFIEKPTLKKLTSMHFYAWKKGLKTGMYYLRSKSSSGAAKFSVDATLEMKSKDNTGEKKKEYTEEEKLVCSLANPEACEACSG